MTWTLRCSLLAVLVAGGGTMEVSALQVNARVTQTVPTIDGKISPEEQNSSAKVNMTIVGGLDKPKYPTTVFTSLTPAGLYVGFICEDPAPDKLVAKCSEENGPVFQDDSVQLFIAPDREANHTNYFHFAVNCRGVKYSSGMDSEEPVQGWSAAASHGKSHWSAEMLIPYSSMNAKMEAPYWRINFARERPERARDRKEVSAWINPGASLHNYKRFGFLQIRSSIPSSDATPVVPTPGSGNLQTTGTAGPAALLASPVATPTSATIQGAVAAPTPAGQAISTSPTAGGVFYQR